MVENLCVNSGRIFKNQRESVTGTEDRSFYGEMVKRLRV